MKNSCNPKLVGLVPVRYPDEDTEWEVLLILRHDPKKDFTGLLERAEGPLDEDVWRPAFAARNKDMAVDILERIRSDYTRHGSVIKLWADMGEFDKAVELAEAKSVFEKVAETKITV